MPTGDPRPGEMWATDHGETARIRSRANHLVRYWNGRWTATEGLDSFLSRFGYVFSAQQLRSPSLPPEPDKLAELAEWAMAEGAEAAREAGMYRARGWTTNKAERQGRAHSFKGVLEKIKELNERGDEDAD